MMTQLTFSVSPSLRTSPFCPRIGSLELIRSDESISLHTPALVTWTSRGVVPHLSRDHHRATEAIRWVHIPFESFLEHSPPVPTLQTGKHALHKFLGFPLSQHILSMSLRDPANGREMPPNGNDYVSAQCVRGVRKVTQSDWKSYVLACDPDVVVALSDSPFTKPPHSQKRFTKSIERSTAWLADILRPIEMNGASPRRLNVLVHMAGGTNSAARTVFADGLTEVLHGKEAEDVRPLQCLDDGVAGYIFYLVSLRSSLDSHDESTLCDTQTPSKYPEHLSRILSLLEASLITLPAHKLRLVNSVLSPHEVLHLIQHVGIDLFDAHWAQKAADIGVALDFQFPVSHQILAGTGISGRDGTRKRPLGHNLFDPVYARDFSKLADLFTDGLSASKNHTPNHDTRKLVCTCAACSPGGPGTSSSYSPSDMALLPYSKGISPPFTRAYLHHLLHTHEMSSHALLAMHNLQVLAAFFDGVRAVLALPDGMSSFSKEVQIFVDVYDDDMVVFEEAQMAWNEVDRARGKGRLAREKNMEADLFSLEKPQHKEVSGGHDSGEIHKFCDILNTR